MISHTNLATLTKAILPFSTKPLTNLTGVQLPGISNKTQKLTLELLEKNHEKYHIFFNERGFHNHLVHHILAAYSCGATEQNLNNIYDKISSYQRPKEPSRVIITRENWREHLGKNELWTDYLDFFDKIIKEDGMEKVFHTYAFHLDLFPRLFCGAFHPVIHLGYGIEFQIPFIVSEGLAAAAIHQNRFAKLINEDYLSYKGTEKKSIIDILQEVSYEKRFDIIVHSVQGKIQKVLTERADVVKEFALKWTIPETEEGVRDATHELYQACILAYGTTGVRPDKQKIDLDFFLMHGLTSVLMVSVMLPYVSLEKRIMLLRAHFASVLSEYIARGRPKLNIEMVEKYTPKKLSDEPNPWLDIVKNSLLEINEPHVIKVIRALIKAEQEWAPNEKGNIYVKIAQLTYEGYEEFDWGEDIGFDEEWN